MLNNARMCTLGCSVFHTFSNFQARGFGVAADAVHNSFLQVSIEILVNVFVPCSLGVL